MQGESLREELQTTALNMKYVMLAMGVFPLVVLAVQVVVQVTAPAQALAEIREKIPQIPVVAACAAISILAVTLAPRLLYANTVMKWPRGAEESGQRFRSLIVVFLALSLIPCDLGLVLFFIAGIYVTIPFHLLSLFCVWRFNLGIESFLDRVAADMTIGNDGGSQGV